MTTHLRSETVPIILNFVGAGIALLTGMAVVGYVGLMVAWMHAPVLPVVGVSALCALPFALVSLGAFALARRISRVNE